MDQTQKRAILQEKALWEKVSKEILDLDFGEVGRFSFDLNLRGEQLRRYLDLKNFRDHYKNPNFQRLPADHPLKRQG